jgi:hypothetical protein
VGETWFDSWNHAPCGHPLPYIHTKELQMFGILGDLTKAVVGVVVETPIAIAADVVTMGGALTDKDEPYTATALKGVMQNVENATKPD